MNATDHAELNGQCRDALLRATYCAQCRGGGLGSEFRVCNGLCSNVARGCLAGVADVDQPWNEWVDALERLTSTLLNNVNKDSASTTASDLRAQDVLSSVDSRLSEAILYALENGPLLEKKVRDCNKRLMCAKWSLAFTLFSFPTISWERLSQCGALCQIPSFFRLLCSTPHKKKFGSRANIFIYKYTIIKSEEGGRRDPIDNPLSSQEEFLCF